MTVKVRRQADRPVLDYVLLCLINMHEDASGYQLCAFIQESTGYIYRAHLSQIYPSLRRLYESKLVSMREVAREGKPDLKLYSITEAGKEAARAWLLRPYEFECTRENADKYLLRIAFMGSLVPEETAGYIRTGIDELLRQRNHHADNNLAMKMDYLTISDPGVRKRYETIWEGELNFILAEYDARISFLQGLLKTLS